MQLAVVALLLEVFRQVPKRIGGFHRYQGSDHPWVIGGGMRISEGDVRAWRSWKGCKRSKLPRLPIEHQFTTPTDGFVSLTGWLTEFVDETTMAFVEDRAVAGVQAIRYGNVGLRPASACNRVEFLNVVQPKVLWVAETSEDFGPSKTSD